MRPFEHLWTRWVLQIPCGELLKYAAIFRLMQRLAEAWGREEEPAYRRLK
jgi:hypothetical protein